MIDPDIATREATAVLSADDPLLTPPDDWVTDPRAVPLGVEPLAHFAEAVADYFSFHAVAIPAFGADDAPLIPPDEHVLDWIARAHDLVDEETSNVRPGADTVYVYGEALPRCDLCGSPARYDTMLSWPASPPVAGYACEQCLRERGDHTLGAGHSTYLMTSDEVAPAVREVVVELCRRAGKPPIWP